MSVMIFFSFEMQQLPPSSAPTCMNLSIKAHVLPSSSRVSNERQVPFASPSWIQLLVEGALLSILKLDNVAVFLLFCPAIFTGLATILAELLVWNPSSSCSALDVIDNTYQVITVTIEGYSVADRGRRSTQLLSPSSSKTGTTICLSIEKGTDEAHLLITSPSLDGYPIALRLLRPTSVLEGVLRMMDERSTLIYASGFPERSMRCRELQSVTPSNVGAMVKTCLPMVSLQKITCLPKPNKKDRLRKKHKILQVENLNLKSELGRLRLLLRQRQRASMVVSRITYFGR